MTLSIWHNPGCSKSCATLALLRERGLEPRIRLYKSDAPGVSEIKAALDMLGMAAIDLIRTNETVFKDLGLGPDSPENDLINAMARHPVLIERPVVIFGSKAAIGRPPENVLTIL